MATNTNSMAALQAIIDVEPADERDERRDERCRLLVQLESALGDWVGRGAPVEAGPESPNYVLEPVAAVELVELHRMALRNAIWVRDQGDESAHSYLMAHLVAEWIGRELRARIERLESQAAGEAGF